MKIIIETIDPKLQRYNTVGDWQWKDSGTTLHVKVSRMIDDAPNDLPFRTCDAEAIIGIHEAIEALLCRRSGVSEKMVDDFDMDPRRIKEVEEMEIEHGDHPKAPYRNEHCIATGVERILIAYLGISWYEYEKRLIEMGEEYDEQH